MRTLVTILLLIHTLNVDCQKLRNLKQVSRREKSNNEQTVIYGSFVQRLGFSSGGFKQKILLVDTITFEQFYLVVKPSRGIGKEYIFFAHIKPGTYAILEYHWTTSTWYGSKSTIEGLLKQNRNSETKMNSKVTPSFKDSRFIMKIESGKINYVGVWNFENKSVQFTNEKDDTDELLQKPYRGFNFREAIQRLPL